jgi:cell division transport system ATP-binding protein
MTEDSIINLENVSIIQNDSIILSDVNLTVKKGEFIYIIGKVGSGKSSIIRVLNAEIPILEGEGSIAGYDLKKIKNRHIPFLRRKLGIVFQDFQLLNDRNIFDNLFFVLKATGWKNKVLIDEQIKDVLDKVGLSDKFLKMPHQLSGGEQQRIVIARALLNNPLIILADEPTGNLDPETSEGIMDLLLNINKAGCTVIMATHNYPLIKKFPARSLRCEYGKIWECENNTTIDFDVINN